MSRVLKKVIPLIVVLVLAGGAIFGYFRYQSANKPPEIQYKTAAVEKRRIVAKVTATGTLSALVTVQVGTQVSGRIEKLYVDFNSPVKKGQLVAKLEPQLFQAAAEQAHANYDSAAASVAKAQAQAVDAERQSVRTKALAAQGLATTQDAETAETTAQVARAQIDVAKAALEQARAALNQANVNLSYTQIVSPIDGVVISRNVDVGQTVAASLQAPVIFTIAEDLRKMQVNTSVAEGDVGRLQTGMPAYFTVDAFPGERFRGKIGQIRNAAQTVQNVVTYDAVIDVDNTDLRLRPGMTANVTVIFGQKDGALAVPNAAMRFKPPLDVMGSASGSASAERQRRPRDAGAELSDTRTVWVMQGAAPKPEPIKVGLTDGTLSEVTGGDLKEGDLVVIDAVTTGKSAGAPPPGGTAVRRLF